MYKRMSFILFPVLVLGLVGAIIWGYQVNQEKNSVLIKAENNYQRAFHDLSFHMDNLSSELGNALAVNSTSQGFHRKCLINVWRLTNEAQGEIGQLPITLMPFHKTEQFLSRMSTFSYQTAVRNLEQEPLTPEELNTLETLFDRSKQITAELRKVQSKIMKDNLRWMDVELALASKDTNVDHAIVDGFHTVNKNVTEYDEVNWGPSMTSLFDQDHKFTKLEGVPATKQEIAKKARKFFAIDRQAEVDIVENGVGTDYNTYTLTVVEDGDRTLEMDYAKNGGQLIWFLKTRTPEQRALSASQAVEQAKRFVEKQQFGSMEAVNYDEFGHTAHVTLAGMQGDVVIFPEKLTVKVALDDGEVLGLQASDYIFHRKERTWSEPDLTMEEVRERLNPEFKVTVERPAVIENDLKNEVVCYEFIGEIKDADYRIFMNADTGLEEKVEEIRKRQDGANSI